MQTNIHLLTESQKVMSEIITSQIITPKSPAQHLPSPTPHHQKMPTSALPPLVSEKEEPETNTYEEPGEGGEHDISDSGDSDSLSNASITSDDLIITYANVVSSRIAKNSQLKQTRRMKSRTITNSNIKNQDQLAAVQHRHAPERAHIHQGHPPQQSYRDSTVHGTGSAPGLHAVKQQLPITNPANRTCTGVFVTRLLPQTTAKNVETYVRTETGLNIKAERLPTKYNTYSSFYIRCEDNIRSSLLDRYLWPKGALAKPFMC